MLKKLRHFIWNSTSKWHIMIIGLKKKYRRKNSRFDSNSSWINLWLCLIYFHFSIIGTITNQPKYDQCLLNCLFCSIFGLQGFNGPIILFSLWIIEVEKNGQVSVCKWKLYNRRSDSKFQMLIDMRPMSRSYICYLETQSNWVTNIENAFDHFQQIF